MTPDEKIEQFQKLVQAAIEKHKTVYNKQVELKTERTMKVIDHKVAAVGDSIQANDRPAAERSLDQALKAVERLNLELDALIAQRH